MKITSIFKKSAVFATAMLLVLVMVVSMMPMASADEATEPTYRITKTGTDHGETLAAMNVSQSGSITMMFYFTGLEDNGFDTDDYIKITVPTAEAGVDRTYTEYYNEANIVDGRYLVKVPVAAAQQTDLVSLQWYKDEVAGTKREYSVKYYADMVLELAANGTAGYVDMANNVISMLNYGAIAQTKFGYNTTNLANKDLFADGTNPIENMTSANLYDAVAGTHEETASIKFVNANAYLKDIVSLRIYVDCPEGATATVNGKAVTINTDENGTYVGIRNIAAHKYATAYDIEVTYGDEVATASYSVLSYCLNVLDYKNSATAEMKDTARALYLYYAWTKNYVDGLPTTPAAECTHGRSYVYGGKAYCSDCGEEAAMRLGLTHNEVTLNAGESKDVTFTLSVAGTVDLQALVVTLTPDSNNVTLTYKEGSAVYGDGSGNLQGETGLNVVVDAGTAVKEACTLATVTYTVTASEAGTYKITPVVQEATNEAKDDVVANIFGAYTVLDVNCTDHTLSYDNLGDKHLTYCAQCQTVIGSEAHTIGAWEPVLAPEGGKVTGELFETGECVCGYVDTREVYYKNNIDSVKVNDTVINPNKANVGQTAGVLTHPDAGYATFVITPENFVDKNGDALTFKDTDSLKTGGWFGVNGGVERYVIRINDGTWKTLAGTPGSTKAGDGGIGSALEKNANFTDDGGRYTNSNYQGALAYHDFEAYAGQTITVTLGAVPANNPGTTENPNVLITAVVENLKIECTHLGQNIASAEATDDPTVFNATCVCGETYTTGDVNEEGLKMFNADEIVYRGAGQGGSNYSITKMTENGLDFARFELTSQKASTTELLYYFANGNTGNATNLTYGLSDTFMIIYRANTAYPGSLTMYVNQGSWKAQAYSIKDDSQWHVALYDMSTLYDDTYGRLNTIRFDIFDAVAIEQGATIDIAYMGFFKSEDHALENYAKAAEKHEAIGKAANWAHSLDGFFVDGTNYKTQNPPLTLSNGQFGCHQVDLNGFTITVDTAITFRGWLVTPFGAEGIYYTITDAEGNVSERKLYVKPGVIAESNGIVGATTSYRYGTGRLNGSAFQSTNNTFDLSGYAGETVSIDVILVNNIGQEGTIMQIKNVAVSACNNHVLVDVEAKASTCATHGNEAYKTCESCGRIYDMNEVELDAIPELPLDDNAHNKVEKTWTAPTATEAGWEAHTACENGCGKAWNAEGEEIAVPTIEKLVPTTNKYFGYEDMKGWTIHSTVTTKPSADRSYVRFERNATSADNNAVFLTGNEAVTGQYMVIKYRTDHSGANRPQLWANTTYNGHSAYVDGVLTAGVASGYVDFTADSEWHIQIIDLSKVISKYVLPNDNGEYVIKWARIDLLDKSASEGYIDLAFIALTDDLSEVGSILLDGDEDYCPHYIADDAVWTPVENDPAHSEKTDCVICGGDVKKQVETTPGGLHIFTPQDIYSKVSGYAAGTVAVKDENGMPYVNITYTGAGTSGEQTVFLYSNQSAPVTNIGGYVAVLYRTSNANNRIEVVADSTLGTVLKGVCQYPAASTRAGQWTLAVKQYNSYGTADTAASGYYDGEQFTAFRLDFFNANIANGDTTDIAFIAYFSSEAEAYEYFAEYVKAYGEESWCEHKYTTTTWVSAEKIYKTVCDACGKTETSDMIYKTEANTSGTAGSSGNFLTVSQEDGFVRYTPSASSSDPYFYPFSTGGTQVTGQFMVIKYRVSNNGTNMTTSAPFAGSLAGGRTGAAGSSGDSSNIWATSTTLYADGEWHYLIVTPDLTKNLVFTPEADGTYHWRWFRMRLNGFAAFDGSCYFDIDEIAFADTAEAASYYVYKNDTTRKNFHYTFNLDVSNNKLNGATFLPKAQQQQTTITIDMSEYAALETPTSLTAGGWVCVTGGVASYKVRVTSVDGVAVENPTLVNWHPGVTRSDIYNAYGKTNGFAPECATGAGMGGTGGTIVDLTAYAGHTVEFEIVAITRFGGEELVAVKYTNVVVPEVAAAE